MKIWIAMIALMLLDSAGNLLMAKGMKDVGEISTLNPRKLLKLGRSAVKNPFVWVGFLAQVGTFFMFLTVLSWADLSLVIPMGALSYLVNILGAQVFLKEKVTKERWMGTLFIFAGVILVSLDISL
ncbi:MAG: EamA family transporter [Chamaesiphon sp.]